MKKKMLIKKFTSEGEKVMVPADTTVWTFCRAAICASNISTNTITLFLDEVHIYISQGYSVMITISFNFRRLSYTVWFFMNINSFQGKIKKNKYPHKSANRWILPKKKKCLTRQRGQTILSNLLKGSLAQYEVLPPVQFMWCTSFLTT